MEPGATLSQAAYARRIAERWAELLGQAIVLSPRDWSVVLDWHGRRIPLAIIFEAMTAAVGRAARHGRAPRPGLAYLAPAVDESWRTVLDGRTGADHRD